MSDNSKYPSNVEELQELCADKDELIQELRFKIEVLEDTSDRLSSAIREKEIELALPLVEAKEEQNKARAEQIKLRSLANKIRRKEEAAARLLDETTEALNVVDDKKLMDYMMVASLLKALRFKPGQEVVSRLLKNRISVDV